MHFTSSDAQAVLPANYTFTSADGGVHTLTNGVTLETTGARTVTATDKATGSITGGASVMVAAAAAVTRSAVADTGTAGAAANGATPGPAAGDGIGAPPATLWRPQAVAASTSRPGTYQGRSSRVSARAPGSA